MQILAGAHSGGLIISGGQETVTVGGYKYIVFTSSGTLTVAGAGTVEVCSAGGVQSEPAPLVVQVPPTDVC